MSDSACTGQSSYRAEIRKITELNSSPHFAYVSHSNFVGMSKRFPNRGCFLGPGGYGNERVPSFPLTQRRKVEVPTKDRSIRITADSINDVVSDRRGACGRITNTMERYLHALSGK